MDGPNTTQANDCLSYRPPSVRSLPTSYLAPVRVTCHCPYCSSCGSHQKQLDTFSSHHTGLNQHSPSIQSVPVYLEGTSPNISLARKSRNCPLQLPLLSFINTTEVVVYTCLCSWNSFFFFFFFFLYIFY